MFQSGKYVLGRRQEFFLLQYLKLCDTFKIPEKLSLDGGAGWSCEPFKPDFYILALHITGIAGFIKVPSSQYTVKFLVWVPVFHMLKIFFFFCHVWRGNWTSVHRWKQNWDFSYSCYIFCPNTGNCVFAVAVAKRGTLDIQRLRGVRSCHNGARWTSGWNIPLGFLLARNDLSWDDAQPLSQGGWQEP